MTTQILTKPLAEGQIATVGLALGSIADAEAKLRDTMLDLRQAGAIASYGPFKRVIASLQEAHANLHPLILAHVEAVARQKGQQ